MNVNSHFKIHRKNGECVSPISEINHLTIEYQLSFQGNNKNERKFSFQDSS